MSEFCTLGLMPDQIRKLRAFYSARRTTLLDALGEHLPKGCKFTRSNGGLFSWVTLPEEPAGVDAGELLERSLAEERIAFVPGAAFFVEGDGRGTLRLTFAKEPDDRIRDGIARLSRLLAAAIERARRASATVAVPPPPASA